MAWIYLPTHTRWVHRRGRKSDELKCESRWRVRRCKLAGLRACLDYVGRPAFRCHILLYSPALNMEPSIHDTEYQDTELRDTETHMSRPPLHLSSSYYAPLLEQWRALDDEHNRNVSNPDYLQPAWRQADRRSNHGRPSKHDDVHVHDLGRHKQVEQRFWQPF